MEDKAQKSSKIISALSVKLNSNQVHRSEQRGPNNSSIQGIEDDPFLRQRKEYLMSKLQHSKQFQAMKKQMYGESSSEEDDVGQQQSLSSQQKHRNSTVEEQKKYLDSKDKQISKQKQRASIYFSIKKMKQQWSPQTIDFNDQSLFISDKAYYLKDIHKIKLIQGLVIKDCHKIKLSTIQNNQLFIGASTQLYRDFPLNYYIFAYTIQEKLNNMGYKLHKSSSQTHQSVPQNLVKNSYVYGKLSKKSKIIKKWQECFIVINQNGIHSYKNFNEKPTMSLSPQAISEIWTRFEVENGQFVIKLLHSSRKIELGLPLQQLLDKKSWLFNLYLLAFPQK